MKKTVTKFSVAEVATVGCVCTGSVNPAVARKKLMSAQLEPIVQTSNVEVTEITMAAGVKAGLHLHPCPVVGVIMRGTISFQIEGEELKVLRAGDAFFEPANRRVTRFDNDSAIPAVFAAFYLLSHEGQELIKMLPC